MHLPVEDDRVHVKHVTGHELLEHVLGKGVTRCVDRLPQLVGRVHLVNSDRRRLGARLHHPRWRHAGRPLPDRLGVEHVDERGAGDPRAPRPPAHRELVPERAAGRLPHAGHEQMLAQHPAKLHVEVVQRHDPIDPFPAREVRGSLANVVVGHVAPDVEELVDRLARPVGLAQLLLGEQQHPAALPLALPQELVTLEVGGDAEQRQRHARPL